ncbi:hypothetical protein PYW08_011873 [Mythimna loreyi]|uniref:Uncharacterized protein n=1 Tax=Mythimna loreyi TaxID=667449 RepID=A0ACC2QNA1_9NEOP|nr:hypothetical protein PYW08_011873 [Mythimna loreyi]
MGPIGHSPKKTAPGNETEGATSTSKPRAFRQTGSSPDLSTVGHEGNITTRLKRKRDDCDCMSRFNEIRSLLSASTAQTDSKFAALQAALSEISAQNTEIQKSIAFMSTEYDDMKLKFAKLEAERESDRRYINELEERVDRMERQLYATKIEIRNVPQKQEENKEDLRAIVIETAKVLGHSLKNDELNDVYRTKSNKNDSSPITADFVSAITKDIIIKKTRKFNNAHKQNKLSTSHLKIDGPSKPIYISEKLAPKEQRIYYLARHFADNHHFKYCWTSYGKVLLRKADGERHVIIKNEADLDSLHRKD